MTRPDPEAPGARGAHARLRAALAALDPSQRAVLAVRIAAEAMEQAEADGWLDDWARADVIDRDLGRIADVVARQSAALAADRPWPGARAHVGDRVVAHAGGDAVRPGVQVEGHVILEGEATYYVRRDDGALAFVPRGGVLRNLTIWPPDAAGGEGAA